MKQFFLIITLILISTGCGTVCDEYDTIVSVETQVIKAVGQNEHHYHYTFESGNKKIKNYDAYRIGESVCIRSHFEN